MFRTRRSRHGATSAPLRLRVAGAVAALAVGVSVLTGCAAGQIAQTADQIPNINGAGGRVGQIGIHNAQLVTPEGRLYQAGSQAPLTLWISNDALTDDTLTGITTDVGTVSISGTATIPARSIVEVGGQDTALTATIEDLTRDLKYGFSIPMTFSFAHAGAVTLNVPIEIPEQRSTPRLTTEIYPAHPPNLWETAEPTPTNLTSPEESGEPTAQTSAAEG